MADVGFIRIHVDETMRMKNICGPFYPKKGEHKTWNRPYEGRAIFEKPSCKMNGFSLINIYNEQKGMIEVKSQHEDKDHVNTRGMPSWREGSYLGLIWDSHTMSANQIKGCIWTQVFKRTPPACWTALRDKNNDWLWKITYALIALSK